MSPRPRKVNDEEVFGAVYREAPAAEEERSGGFKASGGYRYGHVVESGTMSAVQLKDGPRAEIFTGGLHAIK